MPSTMTIEEDTTLDLTGAPLVLAFPTVGLVSTIAGRFLVDTLKLEEIGSIVSEEFMPAAVIHDGLPLPPVRIYGGEVQAPQGPRPVTLILSEFVPVQDVVSPLASMILTWAEDRQLRLVCTLEGTRAETPASPKVFGIGSTDAAKKMLQDNKIKQNKEGLIIGLSGVLLYTGFIYHRDVVCLLAEAHTSYPDSRSAGVLVEALGTLLPEYRVDAKPLFKEADEVERNIRMFLNQEEIGAQTKLRPITQMYA